MQTMNMTRRVACAVTFAAAFGAVVLTASTASAQQPGRIRGEIAKADGAMMSLKTRDGAMLDVKLADDVRVAALVKASLADIKPDSFIGVAGMPEADGSIKAYSIHIFLPAQRGVVPDRHGPWDGRPNSTMTNGYVAEHGDGQGRRDVDGEIQGRREENHRHQGHRDRRGGAGQQRRVKGRHADHHHGSPTSSRTVRCLAKNVYVGRGAAPAM